MTTMRRSAACMKAASRKNTESVEVQAAGLGEWDSTLLVILFQLQKIQPQPADTVAVAAIAARFETIAGTGFFG